MRAIDVAFDAAAWERRLSVAIQLHDVIVIGDRMLGRVSDQHEPARQRVAELLDEAAAAGLSEGDQDSALARAREGGDER